MKKLSRYRKESINIKSSIKIAILSTKRDSVLYFIL
ncbi:carbon storage regulator [bacterium]|nr:carbon storage regulator [bacterium]